LTADTSHPFQSHLFTAEEQDKELVGKLTEELPSAEGSISSNENAELMIKLLDGR
jgi:hypothetical protein